VGFVLIYHAGVPLLTGGYVGVDVFFVISGFLISSHLLRSLRNDGRIRFADFYARRARRILPASLVVLILTVIASLVWLPPLQLRAMFQGAVATALYVPNYYFAVIGTDYLGETTPSLFQHYWSLGIEEQFYLVWPAVLAIGFVVFRRSQRILFVFVLLLTVASFVSCVVVTSVDQPWAFFSLPTRAWELGVGGLVAFLLQFQSEGSRQSNSAPGRVLGAVMNWPGLSWVGLAGLAFAGFWFSDSTSFPGCNAAIPVVATALVIVGGANARRLPQRMLSVRPMVFIGTISYSLYLVHWPVLLIVQAAVGSRATLPLWATVLLAVLCVPLAWFLYRFVETPLRNPRFLQAARPRRSLLLAGAASVALVAVCATGIVAVGRIPLYEEKTAQPYSGEVDPEGTDFVPENLRPSLREASDSNPLVSDNGCHREFSETDGSGCRFGPDSAPTVALFGDSHATHWFPALQVLADQGRIQLESVTKSSCNSVTVVSVLNNEPYPECEFWRQNVIDRFIAEPPDVVILANFARASDVDHGSQDFDSYWRDGLIDVVESLPEPTEVIIVGETPVLGITPSICLSAHLDDADYCGLPPTDAIDDAALAAERDAAAATGAELLDLNPYLCNAELCPAIIDDVLVYRDGHHLTVEFTSELSGVFADAIERHL
jgi:peptidoglycan/LPS O-acetylase OafA/YrhL